MSTIDWTNLAEVIAYAKRLGPSMLVIKYPARSNYNITHAYRVDVLRRNGVAILHTT